MRLTRPSIQVESSWLRWCSPGSGAEAGAQGPCSSTTNSNQATKEGIGVPEEGRGPLPWSVSTASRDTVREASRAWGGWVEVGEAERPKQRPRAYGQCLWISLVAFPGDNLPAGEHPRRTCQECSARLCPLSSQLWPWLLWVSWPAACQFSRITSWGAEV
jgi:hypothetical protein